MDNIIIPVIGTVGVLFAQTATTPFGEWSPLAIVGICVYFFLAKFDKKMDSLLERTQKIEEFVERQKEDEEEKDDK